RYLSGGEALRVFAAGGGTNLSLEVKWRSGKVSVVRGVQGNRLYEISESGAEAVTAVKPPEVKPLLVEVSERLGLTSVDEAYDDFGRQPLLPRRLSSEGPGVSWGDLNGDGVEDLLVGSGRGGRLRVLGGNGRGGFGEVKAAAWSGVVMEDQTGIVNWSVEAGTSTILVGQSNYETGRTGAAVKSYGIFLGDVQAGPELPGWEASVGPVVVADMDGDGDLDVFVGGRVEAGKYPKSTSSKIWRQEGGQWAPDERSNQLLRGLGLVSSAVWTDLNGDGLPELVLAREWDSLKIYGNRSGQLQDDSEVWGVSQAKGLWTGVTAGDLNGDGRLDLVVGNWGRNTVYEGRVEPSVWHGDVDGNGTWEVVESYREGDREVPRRDWRTVGQAVPEVAGRFTSYRSYGEASLEQIYGDGLKRLERRTVNTLDSTVWWNRGTRLEGQALPLEAQVSPVFGVNVGDVDGDGREDVWLSQNFFGVDRETGRMDAGRGVWLQGQGGEKLRALSGAESGVTIYGEGRGSALADFDRDGRVDLVVAQNAGPVRLYRNQGAKAGLRVRLLGLPGNGNAIGAVVRLGTKNQPGPAREIHGGSGWWSQDSAVSVLAWPSGSAELQVRWPGGQTTTHAVPAQAREVRVSPNGALEVVP
ncbi:MAG: VCBS repeat-containing protein, partial [Verrucomicrobia bacterium]|nr:VCBS repeat-containing protein [Verrucomicrobiota bacterium]